MLAIGEVELGRVPRIAVSLTDTEIRRHAAEAGALADIFELRIDQFQRHDPPSVVEVCRGARAHRRPLQATVRWANEGGGARLSDRQRAAIFHAVTPAVDAVDVEFHAPIRDDVVALARAQRRLVIVSHHDFERTPADADLVAVIDDAKRAGADLVKLAVTAQSQADADRLLGLLRAHRAKHLIAISMGPYGVMSRVFFPLVGSLITYGYLRTPAAPGQLSLAELHAELCRYVPERAAQFRPRSA